MVLLGDIRGVVEDVVWIDVDEEDDTSEKDVTENNDLNSDWRRDNDELVSFWKRKCETSNTKEGAQVMADIFGLNPLSL